MDQVVTLSSGIRAENGCAVGVDQTSHAESEFTNAKKRYASKVLISSSNTLLVFDDEPF